MIAHGIHGMTQNVRKTIFLRWSYTVKMLIFFRAFSCIPWAETAMLYEELTYNIQGACFEVYKSMGCGFLEAVYQECLEIEFTERNIPFEAQKELALDYKGIRLRQGT